MICLENALRKGDWIHNLFTWWPSCCRSVYLSISVLTVCHMFASTRRIVLSDLSGHLTCWDAYQHHRLQFEGEKGCIPLVGCPSNKCFNSIQKGFPRCALRHTTSLRRYVSLPCDLRLGLHSMNLSTLWALTWLYAAWLSPENWNYSAHSLRKGNWVQNEYVKWVYSKFIKVRFYNICRWAIRAIPSHIWTHSHAAILESLRPQSNVWKLQRLFAHHTLRPFFMTNTYQNTVQPCNIVQHCQLYNVN